MAKQTTKASSNGLDARIKKAHNQVKDNETKYGFGGDLPEGIEGGKAQLVDCKIGKYEKGDMKGQPFFYAAGIVLEPHTHEGRKVEGLRTSIGPEPITDTPEKSRKEIVDHIDWIENEWRKLGVDTTTTEIGSLADMEEVCATIQSEQPIFEFRTWKGKATQAYPNPRVNHDWKGITEYDGEINDEVEDDTEDEEEPEEVEEEEQEGEEAEEESEEEEEEETDSDDDLDSLGEAADNDDEEAAARLTEIAEENGLDPNDYDTWSDLAVALGPEETGEEEEEEGEEGEYTPSKKDLCYYRPPKARKNIDVEVTAVFASKQTCTVKSLDDGKVFKAVPWAKLTQQ